MGRGRRTQIEALKQVEADGTAERHRTRVRALLSRIDRATRRMINRRTGIEIASLCAAIDHMKKAGVVVEDGTMICPHSRRKVIAYALTERATISGPDVFEYTLKVTMPRQNWQPPEVDGALSKKVKVKKRKATEAEKQALKRQRRRLLDRFRGKR